MSKHPNVVFRLTFDKFLNKIGSKRKKQVITAIKKHAKGQNVLPKPRGCVDDKDRKKVVISNASVVVYYDDHGSMWEFIDGFDLCERAS